MIWSFHIQVTQPIIEGEKNEIHDDVLVALHDSHVSGLGDGCLDVHLLSTLHAVTTVTSDFPPLLVSSQISRGSRFSLNPYPIAIIIGKAYIRGYTLNNLHTFMFLE